MEKKLEFKVDRKKLISNCNTMQCYMAIQELYGTNNCYVFESLAGPSHDVNAAYVGFNKVLSISIVDSYMYLEGDNRLIVLLKSKLANVNSVIVDEDDIYIREGQVFEVLGIINSLFHINEQTNLGFLSFFSYESVRYIENIDDSHTLGKYKVPDIELDLYKGIIEFDLKNNTIVCEELLYSNCEMLDWTTINSLINRYSKSSIPSPRLLEVNSIEDSMNKNTFIEIAHKCLENISDGNIYQIQIGHELSISTDTKPMDIYLRLRDINPSPYMYFAPIGNVIVIGASPELFIKKTKSLVEMRPIAGTAKRTRNELVDEKTIRNLKNNEKELAEHLMLIDLCRNDLAKVCETGSLELTREFFVEVYSHVFHLVSDLNITLDSKKNIFDVIKATFPAGTMTGTPKIEAMKLIEQFEGVHRGLYAGAIGTITLDGNAILALCIRTALYYAGVYYIRASAGIVADSIPENEWNETLNKLAATYSTITGKSIFEVMEEEQ